MTTHRTMADYFAGIPQNIAPPQTLYAAVIEWPGLLSPAPALILARSQGERDAAIYLEIQNTADQLPEWRDAIAATGSSNWRDWIEPLRNTVYGGPSVTEYERTV